MSGNDCRNGLDFGNTMDNTSRIFAQGAKKTRVGCTARILYDNVYLVNIHCKHYKLIM